MKKKGFKIVLVMMTLLYTSMGLAKSLPCVVQHTLITNPNVLETIHRLEAVHEQVKQAQGGFYPTVDVNALYGRERSMNINTGFDWVTLWRKELGVTVRQMLFNGFTTRNQEIRAMSATDAAAFEILAESEDIALAATEAYINILRDREFIEVAEINVKNHANLARMIRRRAEKGVGRKSDIYQAESRLGAAEASLIEIEKQYNDDQITFQQITGLCPDCLDPPGDNCLPFDECEVVKLALTFHPTLKAAVANIEAARAEHRAAFGPNFPRIDLLIQAGSNSDLDGVPGPNRDIGAFIQMQWNLFRGGSDFARQRETAFNVLSASDIRDQVLREVAERISLSWNGYIKTKEKAPSLLSFRENAAKTADSFYRLFMVGRSSLFDLLGVERDRFVAAQQYIDNKYLIYTYKYRVLNNMGQLNKYLDVAISEHTRPCFKTLQRAGTFYGPLEMDYPRLKGGCCRKDLNN